MVYDAGQQEDVYQLSLSLLVLYNIEKVLFFSYWGLYSSLKDHITILRDTGPAENFIEKEPFFIDDDTFDLCFEIFPAFDCGGKNFLP